jgi:hypothetical protein
MDIGRLEILKVAAPPVVVYSGESAGRGFSFSGSQADGYRVMYEPGVEEINRCGATPIRFLVDDADGNRKTFEAALSTP